MSLPESVDPGGGAESQGLLILNATPRPIRLLFCWSNDASTLNPGSQHRLGTDYLSNEKPPLFAEQFASLFA